MNSDPLLAAVDALLYQSANDWLNPHRSCRFCGKSESYGHYPDCKGASEKVKILASVAARDERIVELEKRNAILIYLGKAA